MNIIPAIDIMNGKCVRLTKGDYNTVTEYADDPTQMAKIFERSGAKKLHVVDLDGAKAKKIANLTAIKAISDSVQIPIQFGGGIRTEDDLKTLFGIGVSEIIIGSLAITDPARVGSFVQQFGADRIQVSIDVLNGKPKISGWLEESSVRLEGLIADMSARGITRYVITDISRDGTLSGPNFSLYQDLIGRLPNLSFTASGGVSSIDDLEALQQIGVFSVIIGKAVYENKIAFSYDLIPTS